MNYFNPNLDMNLYKTFCAVAETKSFSKAANMLYVTQPAVSHSIQKLEELLEIKLFYRGAKGVTMTSEAETLLLYIKTAYSYIHMGEQSIKNSKELLLGEVRIGVPTHIASILLIDKIKSFNTKYPNVKLTVQSQSTKRMVEMLENHEIDIIIDNYPITKERMELNVRKILALDTIFVASKKMHEKYNKKINKENINKAPLILPHAQASTRKKLDEYLANRQIKLNPIMEIASTEIILKIIKKDIGIRVDIKRLIKRRRRAIYDRNKRQITKNVHRNSIHRRILIIRS